MKNKLLKLGVPVLLSATQFMQASAQNYHVNPQDIDEGFIIEKVWLNSYALPKVSLTDIQYNKGVALPKGAAASDMSHVTVKLGMDRKKPFAVIFVPAFAMGAEGGINQVSDFKLTVDEQPAAATASGGAAKTSADASSSVLATGTWYKIAVPKTGFYKIDNNFISSLSPKPSNASVANMRIYGNGGYLLAENNAVPRASDLVQNSFYLTDNGNAAIFYGVGTTQWTANTLTQQFAHTKNIYADSAYYFITFTQGAGTQAATQPSAPAANNSVTTFNYYDVHDSDGFNPTQLGKVWYGEGFYPQAGNTKQSFAFDFGVPVDTVWCTISVGHTSPITGSKFDVSLNGNLLASNKFGTCTAPNSDDVMAVLSATSIGKASSKNVNIGLEFEPSDPSSVGYLDYIELNARRSLMLTGDQMCFRDLRSVGAGSVAGYQLQGAGVGTQVWDVTDPHNPIIMQGALSGSVYSFSQDAQALHEFAAVNTTGTLYTPKFVGQVANQNLHASAQTDCIIITYPAFTAQAEQLAQYHRSHDNMLVTVATTEQIYNEFSSGGQDLSAIRDFARMFYKRAGADETQMPKYMILLGGASYDYKNRTVNNSNFVPVYESYKIYGGTVNDLNNFCSDDFYGFLDDSEDISNDNVLNTLDVGVGRLPARSVADAQVMVDKIISYTDPATLGPWRIAATTVADDSDDAGDHFQVAEHMAETITTNTTNLYNLDKVYINAIPKTVTPAGERCPNANAELDNDIFRGVFAINYNGHGNTQIWAGERILTQDDYNTWNNKYMLPFMITATCDFGQFDHPQYVSAAEQLVLHDGGGVIAILTTTQAVFSTYNETLNKQYLTSQFLRNSDGSWNTFGEASRLAKNTTYAKPLNLHDIGETANYRKFGLLGDPALTPAFPQNNIVIDSIVDGITQLRADTIQALGAYQITGSVHDIHGNLMPAFNGDVWVTFYDKPRTIKWIQPATSSRSFQLQDNVVYKGKATVTNGVFSVSFIAPKDINYYYGTGKISTYAHNGAVDAAGTDTSTRIGGYSDNPQVSSTPPVVLPYINDSLFRNGGVTGSNTSLFVSLYDSTGINVSGNTVGHDLVAILDGNDETPYILNDYYETAPNTYKHGFASFPFTGLATGRHSIKVRAWDVNDNMGEGTVDFMVIDGTVVDISNLMNYPNPFTNTTRFVFEHNHPEESLDVQLNIFSTAGARVKQIKQTFTPTGSRSNDITWDGTDDSGNRLPSGVYIYRMDIATEQGYRSTAYQKLVIVR